MKENGQMIYNMVKELKVGMINLDLKDNIKMEKKKDLENIIGQMDQYIMDNGVKINFLVMVYIHGLMEG